MIQLLRGTKSQLDSYQTVIAEGQPVFEKDTGQLKIGNGSSIYSALPYVGAGSGGSSELVKDLEASSSAPNFAIGYVDLDESTRLVTFYKTLFTSGNIVAASASEGTTYYNNQGITLSQISSYCYPLLLGYSFWAVVSLDSYGFVSYNYSAGAFFVKSSSKKLIEDGIATCGCLITYNP